MRKGLQAMDYYMNTLLANKDLKKLVSGTLGEKQSKLPSALCSQMDVPGTFNIEDDYYFNQRKNVKRHSGLASKMRAHVKKDFSSA